MALKKKYVADQFKDGIYYFPQAVPLGEDPLKHLGLDQHTLELSLTPNRADLLSVLGFAYDLAAVLDKKITIKKQPHLKQTC